MPLNLERPPAEGLPAPAATPPLDARIYQEIADNACAALGCASVQIMHFDRARFEVSVVAFAGLELPHSRRALEAIKRLFPNFNPLGPKYPPDINPYLRTVFLDGQTRSGPMAEAASGVGHRLATELAERLGGMRHCMTVPLKTAQGVVVGALSFLQPRPTFTDAVRRTAEAFARQAALTLENAQLSAELRAQIEGLEQSRRLVTENEERVRREISELLHARVQTRLLVAWHRLGDHAELQDETERARLLEDVRHELERIREQDVREASHMLHPAVIRLGLVPAVRSLASRLADALPVGVRVDANLAALDTPTHNRLSEGLRLGAYRVIEEALGNTLRHAQAGRAEVRLGLDERGWLEVLVSDDGRGFEPGELRVGLGLSSLSARVRGAGGTWRISSRPGGPTELVAHLPLEPAFNAVFEGIGS